MYLVATRPFIQEGESEHCVIVFATRSGSVYRMPLQIWEALSRDDLSGLSEKELAELRRVEILVPLSENELHEIISRNRAAIQDNEHLNYVVQPTAKCQLGCAYCGQHHSARRLTSEDEVAIVRDVTQRLSQRRFNELNLCWFGGEPLVGLSNIRTLTPQLQRAADSAGCEYRASVITNGLAMTADVGKELVDELYVCSITVSLDGTERFHDLRRPTKTGHGTFNKIIRNIAHLVETIGNRPIEIKIRCNVDRENAVDVVPLLHQLHRLGIHERIRFYVSPIHAWGNDAHLRSLDPAEFAKMEISWFWEMSKLGFTVGLIPSLQKVVCLAVQPTGVLVDPFGDLYNCTEVSLVPSYGDPNVYSLGKIMGGETSSKRNRLGDFNEKVEAGLYDCSSCRMLPVCGGACPKEWIEGRKPCPSAKINIEDRLLLSAALHRISNSHSETGIKELA